MERILLREIKGYKVFYDPGPQQFFLEDSQGGNVGSGATQKELEEKAEKLSKLKFRRLEVYINDGNKVLPVTVTSLNPEENTGWLSFAKGVKRGWNDSGREKLYLDHMNLYERNDGNTRIKDQVDQLNREIAEKEAERKELLRGLSGAFTSRTLTEKMLVE